MPVSSAKEKELILRMERLNIYEKDLEESFMRSSGPGGQNVNKTSTCVRVRHVPTGIEVKCQMSRSQSENRYLARRLLCDKYEAQILKIKGEKQKEIEKIRRQKRKRSKRAKEKMLRSKKLQSEKKELRRKPGFEA